MHNCDTKNSPFEFCRLIDGENVTNSDEHMWLIPFTLGEDHIVTISFPEKNHFTGIRIWNYNKSTEDTYRGVCQSACSFNLYYLTMR